MSETILKELQHQLGQLNQDQQRQVLDYVQSLKQQNLKGTPGSVLLQFVGAIPQSDLDIIASAIQDDCELIDHNEW